MIYKYGKGMRDFSFLFFFFFFFWGGGYFSLVFYILGAFLIKQLFHSRLLEMR